MPSTHLKIWHGLGPALYMSIIAVVGGLILLALFTPLLRVWDAAPRPEAKRIFDRIIAASVGLSQAVSLRLHNGAFSRYAAVMAVTVVGVGYYAWATGTVSAASRAPLGSL